MSNQGAIPNKDQGPGLIKRIWRFLRHPAATISAGALLLIGVVVGVAFWGSFNWSMEMTNTEEFCIGCHEMEANVYAEYTETAHYNNASGVRATCPDCHVPKEWVHKVVRKVQATRELYHKALGSIDSPAKFEEKRLELATNVWTAMKKTDSRECRNCHEFDSMDFVLQEGRASAAHSDAFKEGKTCIDCHQGIAHSLPANALEAYKEKVSAVYD
ncbi:periplasmic nitrate reductase subunit NapC [Pseudovibrio denitrificans]|uniref:Cytochrome c-type protein n=1 Tax=Pseudovibrio denitrificans TaxID=258256 RepID=A0A1I6Z5G9_9HYPH|nr:NapC/NirT family cytochrome c [Pseudovibrio denitrificans]SFT57661.1 periplasmic nitrate reductase subunit NapC [Pseudovibrio denitrificans]